MYRIWHADFLNYFFLAPSSLQDTILCSDYNVHVPLSHIVPDLLLTDLPKEFIVNTSQLDFDPKDPSTRLGRGGAGRITHMYRIA